MEKKKIKVNLHITQLCNYACKYCFAHFANSCNLLLAQWMQIIDNLAASGQVYAINFAGGEPVLYPHFSELLHYAYHKGFNVSIISNGSLLLNKHLMPAADFALLDTLGISVDSFQPTILRSLGCCNRSREIFTLDDFVQLTSKAREINPAIKLKINTVVSKLNYQEKLTDLTNEIKIDRWKYLKIKYFRDDQHSNEDLLISDSEYDQFVQQNGLLGGRAVVERSLTGSYIMIDNKGNLVDDHCDNYQTVGNLLEESFGPIFQRYNFEAENYYSRYTE